LFGDFIRREENMFTTVSTVVGLLLAASAISASAQSVPAAIKANLAPSGTLRAAINYNNPLLAKRDAATGELSGIAVDLSRELARRISMPLELVPYDAAGKMSAAAKSGAWDIAYLAADPARAADIEFTAPYLELEGTYLVPAGSPLQRIEDVDREGVRIAVTSNSAYDLFLSRQLKHAQLVRADTTPMSIDMLVSQNLDAVAAVRTALMTAAPRVPGSRVMDGHFMTIPQAAGVPAGRPAAARYVQEFIEDVKSSGFVAQALKAHELGPDDAVVAPPAAADVAYVAIYLDVRQTSIHDAATLTARYVRATRADAGNLRADAYQEIGRPDRLIVMEAWKDLGSFDRHETAEHTLEFRDRLQAIERAPSDQRIAHAFVVDPTLAAAGRGALYVVTHVDVPATLREQAETLLKQLSGPSRAGPGHVRYDIYQQNEARKNHFTIFAVWESRGAFDANGTTRHSLQFRGAIAPLLGALYDERLYVPIKP
jgi:polar amino acid transport system substrate-binding protein